MPLARGPRAYTRNYCYVYRRYGETERERERKFFWKKERHKEATHRFEGNVERSFFLERKPRSFVSTLILIISILSKTFIHTFYLNTFVIMNETRGKIDVLGVDRYFLKRRDTFERILNRYAVSTSDCTRIDKAPVSSASRRSVSSDVSPPFFPRASLYPGYVLFMALDRSPQNETDSFLRRERTASSSR